MIAGWEDGGEEGQDALAVLRVLLCAEGGGGEAGGVEEEEAWEVGLYAVPLWWRSVFFQCVLQCVAVWVAVWVAVCVVVCWLTFG